MKKPLLWLDRGALNALLTEQLRQVAGYEGSTVRVGASRDVARLRATGPTLRAQHVSAPTHISYAPLREALYPRHASVTTYSTARQVPPFRTRDVI
jgi:hypothetical protein